MHRAFGSMAGIALVITLILGETAQAQPGQSPRGSDTQAPTCAEMMEQMQEMIAGMQETIEQGSTMGGGKMTHHRHRMGMGGMGRMEQEDEDNAENDSEEWVQPGMMRQHVMAGRHRMMGHGGVLQHYLERLTQQLDLSDDQRTHIQNLLRTHAKEAIRFQADIGVMVIDLQQLLDTEPVDLSKAKQVLQTIAGKETDLRFAHLTLMQEITKLLTPEQQKKFRTLHVPMMLDHGNVMAPRGMMSP
jgi:Spy/CpxP family protein refolding chaperone